MGDCTFAIEIRRHDGSLAGSADASVSTCIDGALLRDVQTGHLPNDGRVPPLRLVPLWNETQRPAIDALALRLGDAPEHRYARAVFDVQARALIQRLLREGRLADGEEVVWQVVAREDDVEAVPPHVTRAPFPLEPMELPGATRGSFDVRFDVGVLRRLDARVRASCDEEGAELLIGHCGHDLERQAFSLRVVDVLTLEAGRGGRSSRHFAFDPGTFLAARKLAAARGDGARPVGWHHNHPACAACIDQPACKVDWVFFSASDLEVHTSAFGSPLMIALVSGKVGHLPARRPGFRLYGWRDGCVRERRFRVAGDHAGAWSVRDGSFIQEEGKA